MACNLTILCHGKGFIVIQSRSKKGMQFYVRSKFLVVAKCNIFPLLYPGYQSILCPDRKCLTYLCVESSQQSAHSPRTPCPCCSRTKKGDFRPPQPRTTRGRGRGAEAPLIDDRKYWLQCMWKTGNMLVKLEDKLDCGRLGVVTTCCCRDNLKMLINDKKLINQRTSGPPF